MAPPDIKTFEGNFVFHLVDRPMLILKRLCPRLKSKSFFLRSSDVTLVLTYIFFKHERRCDDYFQEGLSEPLFFDWKETEGKKPPEVTANIALLFGGYLSLFVVWEIDFLPPATLMKPLLWLPLGIHLVLITLGLSYQVTVQTRGNACICFRCLSPHGSISSCFSFQG